MYSLHVPLFFHATKALFMTSRLDETLDDLTIGGLKIIQAKSGYRFSLDPVLLNGFISGIRNCSVLDLGTGNGIIPLLLSARKKALSITGVEVQPEMAERAGRTIQMNGLQASVTIVQGDIRDLPCDGLEAAAFDVVTANPPYRETGTGRVAVDDERGMARHELAGGLDAFLRAAGAMLKSGGNFYVVYLAERLAELLTGMASFNLEPKRLRFVHPRVGQPARLVLVQGRKKGRPGMKVEPPLVVYQGEGRDYTEEVLTMYGLGGVRGKGGRMTTNH
jgi:tRNA1Val (adenine37-N6)-methyltransferase